MTSIASLLNAVPALNGATAIIVAIGLAAMLVLIGIAVLITATHRRMTVNIDLGRHGDGP